MSPSNTNEPKPGAFAKYKALVFDCYGTLIVRPVTVSNAPIA